MSFIRQIYHFSPTNLPCCALSTQQHTLQQYSSISEVLESELDFLAEQIARAPDNESAWNYLWGLFTLPGCKPVDMARQQKVSEWWGWLRAMLRCVLQVLAVHRLGGRC
jgi:hypothetical protein